MIRSIVAAAVLTTLLLAAAGMAASKPHGKLMKSSRSRSASQAQKSSRSDGPGGLIGRFLNRNKSKKRQVVRRPSRVMHAVVNDAEVQAPKNVPSNPAPAKDDVGKQAAGSQPEPVVVKTETAPAPPLLPVATQAGEPAPPAAEVADPAPAQELNGPIIPTAGGDTDTPASNGRTQDAMPVLTLTPTPVQNNVKTNVLPLPPMGNLEQPRELPTSVPEKPATPAAPVTASSESTSMTRHHTPAVQPNPASQRTSARPRPKPIYIPPRTPNTSRVSGPQYFSASSRQVSSPYPVQPRNDFRAAARRAPLRPAPAYPVSYNRASGTMPATYGAPSSANYSIGRYPQTSGAMYPAPQPNIPYQVGGTAITNQAFHPHEMTYAHRYKAMYPPYYYKVNGSWMVTPWGVWSHENWKPMGTTVEVNYRSRISPFAGFVPPVIR